MSDMFRLPYETPRPVAAHEQKVQSSSHPWKVSATGLWRLAARDDDRPRDGRAYGRPRTEREADDLEVRVRHERCGHHSLEFVRRVGRRRAERPGDGVDRAAALIDPPDDEADAPDARVAQIAGTDLDGEGPAGHDRGAVAR